MIKLKTGIYGLNNLFYGGLNSHSTTVVIGAAGTGKTTFALQFIIRGLIDGQTCIFVSLDENKEQIIKEAEAKGWTDISEYENSGQLVFIDASGKKFADFIVDELPPFVKAHEGVDARIAIDPLTPLIWAVEERYELRELLSFLMKDMKKIGTVVCTVEEHSTLGRLEGEEIIIPMYLADTVIHLKHASEHPSALGYLKIIKCRNSRHDRLMHLYTVTRGLGIVILSEPSEKRRGEEKPLNMVKELERHSSKLSRPTFYRLQRLISELKEEDLAGLKKENVVKRILDEYGE